MIGLLTNLRLNCLSVLKNRRLTKKIESITNTFIVIKKHLVGGAFNTNAPI